MLLASSSCTADEELFCWRRRSICRCWLCNWYVSMLFNRIKVSRASSAIALSSCCSAWPHSCRCIRWCLVLKLGRRFLWRTQLLRASSTFCLCALDKFIVWVYCSVDNFLLMHAEILLSGLFKVQAVIDFGRDHRIGPKIQIDAFAIHVTLVFAWVLFWSLPKVVWAFGRFSILVYFVTNFWFGFLS